MADENLNPLEELKRLDQQVGLVNDLAGLKPIFYRLDEIAKQYSNDFEVQLVVGDIKQHLVNRGTKLKEQESDVKTSPAVPSPSAPPPVVQAQPPLPNLGSAVPPPVPANAPVPPPMPAAVPPPLATPTAGVPPKAPWETGSVPPLPTSQFTPPVIPSGPSAPPPIPPPMPQSAGPHATTEQAPPPVVPPTLHAASPPPSFPPSTPPPVIQGAMPQGAMPPHPPQAPPPKSGGSWKGALIIGAILGLLLAAAGIGFLVIHKRNTQKAAELNPTGLQVQVATTPPGASIRVNGEDKCTSPCAIPLAAGDYQVTAFLPGYEPGANGVTVAAGAVNSVSITLEPSPQSVRILAEGLDGGEITVDDQPAGQVQDGQFVIDNVKPGPHSVKIVGKGGEASFSFEAAEAKLPTITGTVSAKNVLAVLVSSFGNNAHLVTSSGPLKLTLNGQPQADASPSGVDLQGFQAGPDEIAVGEGPAQKTMQDTFGPAPGLTAFLKSDKAGALADMGTILVVTGEDDVRVFINNKEQRRHTAHGQLRIPFAPGKVTIRVLKDGFQQPPPQTANVQKGTDSRVEFQMQKIEIAPPKPVTPPPAPTNGGNGTIRVTRTPSGAAITYKRDGEAQGHDLQGNQINLPAGTYIFTSKALGYADRIERVQIAAGETKSIDLTLAAARPVAPVAKAGSMADFEDPSTWSKDGDAWVHKGGNFLPYKLPAKGTFVFTVQLLKGGNVFRSGHIRWYADYKDPKNYGLFEIDKKTFWAKEVVNGKTKDREKTQHGLENQKTFTIQIEVTPEHIVHRLKNGEQWIVLDSWTEPGRNFSDGKFGFYIPGNDELGITDFRFTPR